MWFFRNTQAFILITCVTSGRCIAYRTCGCIPRACSFASISSLFSLLNFLMGMNTLLDEISSPSHVDLWKHVRDHGRDPSDISLRFKILRKCQSKFDCLIYEMLFIKELKPTLNTQSDSIRAKLFLWRKVLYIFFCLIVF